jgi:serine kinase of HPr protein (carbohydrate metabolism regulator)
MKKKLSLREIFQGRIIRLGIKELFPAADLGKELTAIHVRTINRLPFCPQKKDAPTIAILTPKVLNQLSVLQTGFRLHLLEDLSSHNVCFILLSSSLSIPVFLKKSAAKLNIPFAASKYDEHYLRSILIGLIREKYLETISLHGVVLEAKGKGILITGASGIGKTTAALKSVAGDCYWVADDIAVVKRNKKEELIAGGNKKISRYIHTERTGIIPVDALLNPERIKNNTKLAAVIRIGKSGTGFRMAKGYTHILGKKLTCLRINIASAGFFGENLLKKAIEQLFKDNL